MHFVLWCAVYLFMRDISLSRKMCSFYYIYLQKVFESWILISLIQQFKSAWLVDKFTWENVKFNKKNLRFFQIRSPTFKLYKVWVYKISTVNLYGSVKYGVPIYNFPNVSWGKSWTLKSLEESIGTTQTYLVDFKNQSEMGSFKCSLPTQTVHLYEQLYKKL